MTQQMLGAIQFRLILRVDQRLGVGAHGKAVDLPSQPLQSRNLAPDEAVRGTRIGVDQIGKLHEDPRIPARPSQALWQS